MKRLYKIFYSGALSAILLSSLTVPALASQAKDYSNMLDSYYYQGTQVADDEEGSTQSVEIDATDVGWGILVIDTEKLIPIFDTYTGPKEDMIKFCEKIRNGERLSNLIIDSGEFYTILNDTSGNEVDYEATIKRESLEVLSYGETGERFRLDFRLTDDIKRQLDASGLDVANAKAVFCDINGFTTGTLIYDDKVEYFMPTVEIIQSIGLIEVGKLYSVPELVGIIENNMESIYPETGFGIRPNTGGGSITPPQIVDNVDIVDQPAVADQLVANATYNNVIYIAIAGAVILIAGIVCYTAFKKRQ